MADVGSSLLFADHVEARQMGEYVREFRFPEPVALHSVRILARGQKPSATSSFEGRTFPDVRTMSLNVFASDRLSTTSTMPRLRSGESAGVFLAPGGRFVSDVVVVRGVFIRLSVAIYGTMLPAGEALPEAGGEQERAGVAPHLRPATTHEADRLDLADFEGPPSVGEPGVDAPMPEAAGPVPSEVDAAAVAASAPAALPRAVALGTLPETNARLAEHTDWVASLQDVPGVLEADDIVQRLETLIRDIGQLAQKMPDASSAHVSYGPVLARALLALTSRCMERLEFRPLHAALRALEASLVAAPTAAEVLKRGGLTHLLAVLREGEWAQISSKVAALQALLQLCAHAIGMEALLGWASPTDGVLPQQGTGYEVVLSMILDGASGSGATQRHSRLEQVGLTLLQRAGFYMTLAKLDAGCAKLAAEEAAAPPPTLGEVLPDELLRSAAEALAEVAEQFERLSRASSPAQVATDAVEAESLLAADCPRVLGGTGADPLAETPPWLSSSSARSDDPFAFAYPQMHGYLECFLSGRRLLPALCTLLRRLPRAGPSDRLAVFAPLRRLACALLASVGGAQFLASDPQTFAMLLGLLNAGGGGAVGSKPGRSSKESASLPPVPRFPEPLVRSALGAQELAGLLELHVHAVRLVMLLVAKTRQSGRNGMLPEDGLPLLAALHRLCVQGSAGRDAVVCAFRSPFLVEWLLRQLHGRLEEGPAGAGPQVRPSVRHLVAILHALVLGDPTASAAARFGARCLALCGRAIARLEPDTGAGAADTGDSGTGARPGGASLEFALDSEGPEGGLGRAVRLGRKSADVACLAQLRALSAQLRPFQAAEGEPAPMGLEELPVAKLLACVRLAAAPKALKRSVHEERGSRIPLALGGFSGVGPSGVEVPEVDYGIGGGEAVAGGGDQAEAADDRERFPSHDSAQLPLLVMRLLRRRAASSAREALSIVTLGEDSGTAGSGSRFDGLGVLVPILIRCAGGLNLNLDALSLHLKDDGESIDDIYATQYAHCQLLEATLQTCFHLLRSLRAAGLGQYRHTELLHALFLVVERLGSGLVGMRPGLSGGDPEFRLLWRHCLIWACRVFRTWAQGFPDVAGGQLLQPLFRHMRVLPWHYLPGMLLLSTCGSLEPLLPKVPHSFSISAKPGAEALAGEALLQSKPVLVPASTRGGEAALVALSSAAQNGDHKPQGGINGRGRLFGQLWGRDAEALDWDAPDAAAGPGEGDALVRALARRPATAGVAMALGLVGRVNARRERLSMDDIGEAAALVAQCSVTSDAVLHLATAAALEKLASANIPALGTVLNLAEAALNGSSDVVPMAVDGEGADGADRASGMAGMACGGAAKDPRDARAVARILMLLTRFGARGRQARRALVQHRAETLCLSVLAHSPTSNLPAIAVTHAIRVLSLMFCSGPIGRTPEENKAASQSVPKLRMMSKSLSLLLNRTQEDGPLAGPAAMAAALELLLRLNSTRSMCLNLLFSPSEETTAETAALGLPIPVAVSCAFKLGACAKRLARELAQGDEFWNSTPRASESEAEAEEALGQWLHVGELVIQLCQTVLVNCPTASMFLAVVLPQGLPAAPDEDMMRGVLSDLQAVLERITGRTQRAETVPLRAAALVGNLRALQRQLVDTRPGPPPATLAREELVVPPFIGGGPDAESGDVDEDRDVLEAIVALLGDAAELEADPEWLAVAELDSTDPAPSQDARQVEFVFDGAAHRRKRKEAIEKANADRKAKRLKLAQRAEREEREKARRRAEDERRAAEKAAKKPPPAAAPEAQRPPPAKTPATQPGAAAGSAPAETAAPAKPVAAEGAGGPTPVEALQLFVKEHPEFMRVLKNPAKCLSDPRVKSMFVSELENYPQVKKFLAAQGVFKG